VRVAYLREGSAADSAGETAVAAHGQATAGAGGRRGRGLDVVGQWTAAGEHSPVVWVVLVDVLEEPLLALAQPLADLARQVVRTRQRTRQLLDNNIIIQLAATIRYDMRRYYYV